MQLELPFFPSSAWDTHVRLGRGQPLGNHEGVQENCEVAALDTTQAAEPESAAAFLIMLEREMPICLNNCRKSACYLQPQTFRIPQFQAKPRNRMKRNL